LSFGTYAEGSPALQPGGEDEEDVIRRHVSHLLAVAGIAAFGSAVPGLGRLLGATAASASRTDIPSRVGRADIETVRGLTTALADAARTCGGQAGAATSLAGWADQLLDAQASDSARLTLRCALSDLHVIAAWCCHDSDAPAQALHHFGQAVHLATEAGDAYQASYALRHAAMMLLDRGKPNDALKLV